MPGADETIFLVMAQGHTAAHQLMALVDQLSKDVPGRSLEAQTAVDLGNLVALGALYRWACLAMEEGAPGSTDGVSVLVDGLVRELNGSVEGGVSLAKLAVQ